MKFISDAKLVKIPIKDNREKLVNLRLVDQRIIINLRPENKKLLNIGSDTCIVRESVAMMLRKAQDKLPLGYRLMIFEGYRSNEVQNKLFKDHYKQLKKDNPYWTKERLNYETGLFVAPFEIVPPHTTGGAVDLTIVGKNLKELDMGTKIHKFDNHSKTDSKLVSRQAQENRKMLIDSMVNAGFVNYPLEWWHWSYGDRYWAATLGKEYSIYDSI